MFTNYIERHGKTQDEGTSALGAGGAEARRARPASLSAVTDESAVADTAGEPGGGTSNDGTSDGRPRSGGPRSLDGVTSFMGMRWQDPETVRLTIRPELINRGGLLSGVVTFALVDYCMGSTLWAHTTEQERIATINISINYVQTAVEGEIVCRTTLDRRNRRTAVMRSEVRHDDGRLLVTAIGSYTIFQPRDRAALSAEPPPGPAA